MIPNDSELFSNVLWIYIPVFLGRVFLCSCLYMVYIGGPGVFHSRALPPLDGCTIPFKTENDFDEDDYLVVLTALRIAETHNAQLSQPTSDFVRLLAQMDPRGRTWCSELGDKIDCATSAEVNASFHWDE